MFSFINPFMPWALGLLLLPPLILLIRRRRVVLRWAAFDWMKRAIVSRRKVSKLEKLLKFLSKLALLLFLLLAISRPAWRSTEARQLLIIDVSPSMGASLGGGTRLDAARQAVSDFAETIGGEFGLAKFDGSLTVLAEAGGVAAPEQLLAEVDLSARAGSFPELVNALLASGTTEHYDAFIFFSDFQRRRYGDVDGLTREARRLGDSQRLVFVPVDPRTGLLNVAIESVSLPAEGFFTRTENRIVVRLRNFSNTPVEFLPVTLLLDGEPHDRAMVSIPPNAEASVRLTLRMNAHDTLEAVVAIPPDDYPLDDRFHFLVNRPRPLRALVVRRSRADDPFDLDVFFRAALESFEDVRANVLSPHQLAAVQLDDYDMIATFGIPFAQNEATSRGIMEYLERGGGLIAFADLDTPGQWGAFNLDLSLVSDDEFNPDIERSGFFDFMREEKLDPGRISFFRHAPFANVDERPEIEGRVFPRGRENPITVAFRHGEGRAVLSNWMPFPGYSNVFYNPNFVQFTMRMVAEAIGRDPLISRGPEEITDIIVDERDLSRRYSLALADGSSYLLSATRSGNRISLRAEPMVESQFCAILKDGDTIARFGYNLGCHDSDIEPLAPAAFEPMERAGVARLVDIEAPTAVSATSEFSGLFLVILFLAALFENYAHFWHGRRARK